jgi:hypothetical protein
MKGHVYEKKSQMLEEQTGHIFDASLHIRNDGTEQLVLF